MYAALAANKGPEDMTDSELRICSAAGSAESAMELGSTGELSDVSLKQALK